ncbi:hypothetical protein [Burkholderia cepacia]|uniref:phage tail fiber protein n=1 Tax=Burkholderia cepacia TaxID=292 RepID=UPI002FE20524
MPALQKINQGTPPSGQDGDSVRTGFAKVNANSDVLAACVALGYKFLSDNSTLTPGDVGTRFGLNMGVGGKVVKLPLASSVSVNACVHFFNVGPPVTIGFQGNDGSQIKQLNTGDWATYVADGGTYWHVAERGRMLWDETVGGNLAVGGTLTAAGAVKVGQSVQVAGGIRTAGQDFIRSVSGDYGVILRNDGSNVYLLSTKKGDPDGQWNDYRPLSWGLSDGYVKIDSYGAGCSFGTRPTWMGGLVPWDNGNLPRPLQHSDIGAIAAAGGETRDLSISFEPRLALNFIPKANSVFATASLYINIGQHPAVANDFIAYLTVFDVAANAQVAGGASSIISVPNGALYVGLSSAGALTCSVAHGSLVIGRQYQVLLYVRKVQPVGPVYPAGMSINGVVV